MTLWEIDAGLTVVAVKPDIVKVAGDLAAGAVLCQILYWCRPDKHGVTKLKVFRDGRRWIAKTCQQWCEECSITPKQYRRVVRQLQLLGVIERKTMKFGGETMTHISLNEQALAGLLEKHLIAEYMASQ